MIRAAYWTCALLALAHARIYERCELARELRSLGVSQDDISTWVCITYHESRFDTAAQNGYSGDHGLFQISELYWCGPGKACGLPCSALRDEDISDDLECALKIREEHTRLQGDGFLAWVVYPQHCKHNTKKYIVDCDIQSKNANTVRTPSRSRSFNNPYIKNVTSGYYYPDIDNLKPPYLTVNSIVRGGYAKMLEEKNQNSAPFNWLNYKVDNIDELTLPVSSKQFDTFPRFTTTTSTPVPTTSTTTTTTTAYPPIKVWRRIETNQFRKKLAVDKKPIPTKWLELGKPTSNVVLVTTTDLVANASLSSEATTARPSTEAPQSTTIKTSITSRPEDFGFTTISTTTRWFFTTTTAKPITTKATTEAPIITDREYKPFTFATQRPPRATEKLTTETEMKSSTTAYRPVTFSFPSQTTPAPSRNFTENYRFRTVSFGSTPESKATFNFFQRTPSIIVPTSSTENKPRTTFNSVLSTTITRRPSIFDVFTTTTPKPSTLSFSGLTNGITNPFKFSSSSRTSRLLPQRDTPATVSSSRPFGSFTSTHFTTQRATTSTPIRSITQSTPPAKISQSIFDLYLSPTQWPKLPTRKFPELANSAFKLKIFLDGTTAAPVNRARSPASMGGAARNHIKRQTLQT